MLVHRRRCQTSATPQRWLECHSSAWKNRYKLQVTTNSK